MANRRIRRGWVVDNHDNRTPVAAGIAVLDPHSGTPNRLQYLCCAPIWSHESWASGSEVNVSQVVPVNTVDNGDYDAAT